MYIIKLLVKDFITTASRAMRESESTAEAGKISVAHLRSTNFMNLGALGRSDL
jgi:hypothetical protein